MTQNITTYYIPQNLNINKGKIYTLYLNKITNLDLSSIITNNSKTEELLSESITISKDDYNKLLALIDKYSKLYSENQDFVSKLSKGRGK